jgi:hypothetical protein
MTDIESKAGIENQGKIIEKKTYLFIANISDEQVYEITSMINTSFERFDNAYDDVVLVCDRGIKFGGY